MTHDATEALFDELGDLLEQERAALLKGDFDKISSLLSAKENLVERLNSLDSRSSLPLKKLQAELSHNQVLLDSALKGIRRAAARLAAIRHIRKNLETYGRDGRKHVIKGDIEHKIEKRS